MTDIKLLPLPEWAHRDEVVADMSTSEVREEMTDYARANVAHATAAKDAEIEALRAEVAKQSAYAKRTHDWNTELLANNERLAEALRELLIDMKQAQSNMKAATQRDPLWEGCAEAIQPRVAAAEAALRDHDQEGKDG